MSEETRVSDLKGVPKRVILTAPERVYPTTLIAYADLIVQDGMVVKDRHGMTREATSEDLASCKTLTPTEAKVAVDAAAWRGETPAEGTRRAIVLEAIRKGDVLSDAEALEIADTVELALLGSGDDEREADAQEAINAVGNALDRIDAPQGATYAERIDRLYREFREKREIADVRHRIDKGRLVDFDRVHNLLDGWEIRRTTDEDAIRSLYDRARELIEWLRRTEEDKEVDGRRDATIKQLEADVERFLGEREEARSGESRFAEERDCAFALLRWLLPVTVAKRID
jgi:hypothetical protein